VQQARRRPAHLRGQGQQSGERVRQVSQHQLRRGRRQRSTRQMVCRQGHHRRLCSCCQLPQPVPRLDQPRQPRPDQALVLSTPPPETRRVVAGNARQLAGRDYQGVAFCSIIFRPAAALTGGGCYIFCNINIFLCIKSRIVSFFFFFITHIMMCPWKSLQQN